jgi:DNA-directed RNA polymerase subunit RPC12/RpoP
MPDSQNGVTELLTEYCPRCKSVQNMNIISIERVETNEKGQAFKIPVTGYKCSKCGLTVKNE